MQNTYFYTYNEAVQYSEKVNGNVRNAYYVNGCHFNTFRESFGYINFDINDLSSIEIIYRVEYNANK